MKPGGQIFTVNQSTALCSYALATYGTLFGQVGGTGTIQITASGPGCTPAISSNQTWTTTGALTGPTGNNFAQPFTVSAFSSASNAVRVARVTVGGRVFYIKQTSW